MFKMMGVRFDGVQEIIIRKPHDQLLAELIETKKELEKLKKRVKTLEQNQGTLSEDVDHLYELI